MLFVISACCLCCCAGLEIATILVPHAFLVLGSCANMIKGLSWMAGGSTRSVFNLSFVRDNNIAGTGPVLAAALLWFAYCPYIAAAAAVVRLHFALCRESKLITALLVVAQRPHHYHFCLLCTADITAKNTSQYIFASLFGTAAGVSCCAYIGQSAPLALLCFSGLAYTSMYSAYRTVKSIPLPTLNSSRLQLLAAR
jgi:hypothetical protein